MPKPQVYIGYFPKTEKYSNEDILQLLEGQNRALRIGDWRILNRVDRGNFGQVHIKQKSKHSAEAKNAPAVAMPVSGKVAQTSLDSLELPTCSNSLTPTTRSSEDQSSEAAGSNMAAPSQMLPPRSDQRPVPHRHLKCLQANLHQAKAASDVLSCRYVTKDLDVAFLQEPWILSGKIKGLNTKNGRLIYASEQQRPKAALLLNKKVTFLPLSQFITEDLVAVWAKMPTACGEKEAVIASAYFPGDTSDAPPREVGALVEYCQRENLRWIIGCDTNAHRTVWESTNINNRGEFLIRHYISILNRGDEPTFINAIRGEVLDLTICSNIMLANVSNWHVSNEISMSDHQHIRFEIGVIVGTCPVTSNPSLSLSLSKI
ncbi:hypothetical protein ACLKA6_003186 [Drosophila palustris]